MADLYSMNEKEIKRLTRELRDRYERENKRRYQQAKKARKESGK